MKEQRAHQTRAPAQGSQQPQQTYGGNPQLPIRFDPPRLSWQEAAKTQAYDFMEEDSSSPPRSPTSSIRYPQAYGLSSGGQATRTAIPQQPFGRRTQAQTSQVSQQQPRLTSQRPQHATGQQRPGKPRPRIRQRGRTSWALYPVVGVLAALALWVSFSSAAAWWQQKQDDWTYGTPRTYQTDAVVGHNHDSRQHPSHFLAINLHGQVEIIELPAGDPSKAVVYPGPTLGGPDADQEVVTVSFQDVDHDGTPDLVLHFGTSAMVLLNKDGKFAPLTGQLFSAHTRGGAS